MISFLKSIVEAILLIPQYILWAIETLFNLLMDAITALFSIVSSLIPLPSEPSPPEFIAEINWFFPIGAVITVAGPIVIGYSAFLAIRWALAKAGNL